MQHSLTATRIRRSRLTLLCAATLAALATPLIVPPTAAHAQSGRPADPMKIGTTVHFTLDKNEEKDFKTEFGGGSYYIVWDMARAEGNSSNIMGSADLLKTNGALVTGRIINANEIGKTARVAGTFKVDKPLAARIRVKNDSAPMEYWMTVMPVSRKAFIPFGFPDGELKPLGIGEANGKGGTLDKAAYAYHKIQLPAGKWDVSVYLKQTDDNKTNLMGHLDMMDPYGAPMDWKLNVNEIGLDTRQEKRLLLLKPATVIFRVVNENNKPVEYTIDIEKATN